MIIRFLLIVIGLICQINVIVPQPYPSSHHLFLGEQKVTNHLFNEAHQNPEHKRFGRVLNNDDLQCPMENTHCVDNHVISYDFIPTWKDCGQLCYLEKACKFWTFRLSTNVCFLKYACEKPISGISSSISGYHTCVQGKLSIEEDCKEQELFNKDQLDKLKLEKEMIETELGKVIDELKDKVEQTKEQLEQLKSEKETIETKLQQVIEELKACKEDQTKIPSLPDKANHQAGKVRADSRCGEEFPIDGSISECDSACCSEFGWCGSESGDCDCPTCVDYRLKYFRGHWYFFYPRFKSKVTWNEAQNFCEIWFNGNLASIHSQEEWNFIWNGLSNLPSYWRAFIGGYRLENTWYWNDGTEMDWPELENKWRQGEPNNLNGEEWLMELASDNRLNDVGEHLLRPSFVCKWSSTNGFK